MFLKNRFISTFLTFSIILFSLSSSFSVQAQDDSGGSNVLKQGLGDAGLVLLSGVAGAILGLSTLSFTEHPSRHYKSIVGGAALGIIVGVGVVITLKAMEASSEMSAEKEEVARTLRLQQEIFQPASIASTSITNLEQANQAQSSLQSLAWHFTF